MKYWLIGLVLLTFLLSGIYAEDKGPVPTAGESPPTPTPPPPPSKFSLESYGIINYEQYNWDWYPDKPDSIDLRTFALEGKYKFQKNIELEAEIEFEHGGTGSTMEYDYLEEFGEFETEIEKGGEVTLEKLELEILWTDWFNVKMGHIYLPVGLISDRYRPGKYFTVNYSETEAVLLPAVWHETGFNLFGNISMLHYQFLMVTGLDSTGFSRANWIKNGHQSKFETVNAENFGYVGRLDFKKDRDNYIGLSGYYGDTTGNRPKQDLYKETNPNLITVGQISEPLSASVTIVTAHAVSEIGALKLRGLVLFGQLEHALQIAYANQNLSNFLNVKRTAPGEQVMGYFVEGGWDIFSFFRPGNPFTKRSADDKELTVFFRFDHYDTLYKVNSQFENKQFEKNVYTGGLNFFPMEGLLAKGQFSYRKSESRVKNTEKTVSFGFSFEIE